MARKNSKRVNFTWLAPAALTPMLVACALETSWKRRLWNGWAAGFGFWLAVCCWIQFVLEVRGGLGRWLNWLTFFLFAILKGLHMALFAWLAGFAMRGVGGPFRRSPRCGPAASEPPHVQHIDSGSAEACATSRRFANVSLVE